MKLALVRAATGLALAAALQGAAISAAAETRALKIQTSANASHFSLAYLRQNWVPKLNDMLEADLTIELLPIESVVPRRETPEAIGLGILDGDLTSVSYFSGVDPAYALIGDLIAGYDTPAQVTEFCMEGGGKELLQELHDTHFSGIQVVGCGAYNREALVSKVPIHGVDDLKGIKIRAPEGLASDVFRRAGATPVSMAGSETYSALEKGVIDAADNSAYANNDANGMHKVAKFPLYPGIHSMPVLQFTVSKEVWNSLSEHDRQALRDWFVQAFAGLTEATNAEDLRLVERDRAAGELTIIDWPQEERDRFRAIAQKAWEDFAAQSPLARKVYEAHVAFMKKKGLL
ncbi:TRAP-type mannitol/chloroaromatic compound transport system, substrate-binding protein [Meinhardsimonia xiamenensis]|jgi:TRAP-type C4-dicarboxylate transport system substrate-binding protein|uniref:TRAP-type mannitol/chloroaromatic compound transport system, substrate-binding protein n=1 Tax=Meinhardsimonia xiamenensis TaxID=990712 RepID=A0A1G9ADE8_9RHOB|nr:TRAP transporter substrate-binding protein [Meinhardsimonia xiamenensis]PRX35430.1 TRAP-type mannitol/chloroaromatic compound transport system substrate-binding protein [Meinhardsimonia xiamenensis]SDK25389.1 TRAP-type mannitol/chloroaromatic compound transport system, substrate-binding protein [Meinhardsimonia xiamenensis]